MLQCSASLFEKEISPASLASTMLTFYEHDDDKAVTSWYLGWPLAQKDEDRVLATSWL